MQRINHSADYRSVHRVFDEFERFYLATSESSQQGSNMLMPYTFDTSFKTLQGIFNVYGNQNYDFKFADKRFEKLSIPKSKRKTAIIAFSGGKDSVAVTLKYIKMGYEVYLYHLRGLKKSTYPDEWKSAQAIADYLKLPLIIEDIDLVGNLEFPEHPLKNIIIANNMLQWGIRNGVGTHIVFGNYFESYLDCTAFYYSGDDCIDMWEAYEEVMDKLIPDFKVGIELDNPNDTLETISEDKTLLSLCQSCLCVQRFREYNRKRIMKKYEIDLMPNRCGSCWKDAVEYIYMTDNDVLQYNESYYKHCLDVLKKANKHENKIEFTTIEDLWKIYFSYDIHKSKYLGILNYGKRKVVK